MGGGEGEGERVNGHGDMQTGVRQLFDLPDKLCLQMQERTYLRWWENARIASHGKHTTVHRCVLTKCHSLPPHTPRIIVTASCVSDASQTDWRRGDSFLNLIHKGCLSSAVLHTYIFAVKHLAYRYTPLSEYFPKGSHNTVPWGALWNLVA